MLKSHFNIPTGPKITLQPDDLTKAQQQAIVNDGLEIDGLQTAIRKSSDGGKRDDVKASDMEG